MLKDITVNILLFQKLARTVQNTNSTHNYNKTIILLLTQIWTSEYHVLITKTVFTVNKNAIFQQCEWMSKWVMMTMMMMMKDE